MKEHTHEEVHSCEGTLSLYLCLSLSPSLRLCLSLSLSLSPSLRVNLATSAPAARRDELIACPGISSCGALVSLAMQIA